MNDHKRYQRYQRQTILKEFGLAAQEKLLQAKVLVIGAGGLGCPALQYLTAAGVGTIGIVDDDVVSLTNLHRQVLYNMKDIGLSKAETASNKLRALNDEIIIIAYNKRLTNKNALEVISEYDLVIDGTDTFSSRYMINDACVLLDKPLIYGAISKFEGQVAVFNVKDPSATRTTNYRDLFPAPPDDDEVLNCAEAGVLGVLPGIIGTMQASETIKLITGIGKPLINHIITYNVFDNRFFEFDLSVNDAVQRTAPQDNESFLKTDYEWLCSSQRINQFEIETGEFDKLINNPHAIIVDVREQGELPLVEEFEHLQIPVDELLPNKSQLATNNIALFCQSGKRSLQAAKLLNKAFNGSKTIYSLKGGIVRWKNEHSLQL